MSHTARIEIEVRLFIFTCLGEMKQAVQLVQAAADRSRLLADLLRLYPLERWHEQRLISEDQIDGWIAQVLALLLPAGAMAPLVAHHEHEPALKHLYPISYGDGALGQNHCAQVWTG